MKKFFSIHSVLLLVLAAGASQATAGEHSNLTFSDYPNACLNCHQNEYDEMMGSTHYKWTGEATDMLNGPSEQGKLTNAMNTYCINILGNWPVCGSCHVGRGVKPGNGDTMENVDCLMCHSEEYALARTRLADGSMGVLNPTDSMVQNIHTPKPANCLKCHAFGGGGDGVKRGDIANALKTNTDPHYDVHMNTAGADVACIDCHSFNNHRVIGKGSDLRPTDDPSRGAEVSCVTCHINKDTIDGHSSKVRLHVDNVACQVCHIPTYAKSPTETHRIWTTHHDGTSAENCDANNPCPGHPDRVDESNLTPTYKFWNRISDNYLLGDVVKTNPDTGDTTYQTSMPQGMIFDPASKIYPFKYKTSQAPISSDGILIAVDTFEYLKGSGNINTAIESGVYNMRAEGILVGDFDRWVTTDTYQLINHGVEPKDGALHCSDCHDGSGESNLRMPFTELGYHTWPAKVKNCTLCHEQKSMSWQRMHEKHAEEMGKNCAACHTTEPTGFVEEPTKYGLCNNCHSGESYSDPQKLHERHAEEEHGGMTTTCTDCHTFDGDSGGTPPPPPPQSCSDYTEAGACNDDADCNWSSWPWPGECVDAGSTPPPTQSCSDYTDEDDCKDDSDCEWHDDECRND